MKNFTICCYCLFFSTLLTGQVTPKLSIPAEGQGSQSFINFFEKANQNLGQHVRALELSYHPGTYTTTSSIYLHKRLAHNYDYRWTHNSVETSMMDFYLGPEAFFNPWEVQDDWGSTITPFIQDLFSLGNAVGGEPLLDVPLFFLRSAIENLFNERPWFERN